MLQVEQSRFVMGAPALGAGAGVSAPTPRTSYDATARPLHKPSQRLSRLSATQPRAPGQRWADGWLQTRAVGMEVGAQAPCCRACAARKGLPTALDLQPERVKFRLSSRNPPQLPLSLPAVRQEHWRSRQRGARCRMGCTLALQRACRQRRW